MTQTDARPTEGILLPQSDLWNLANGLTPLSLAFAVASLEEYFSSG